MRPNRLRSTTTLRRPSLFHIRIHLEIQTLRRPRSSLLRLLPNIACPSNHPETLPAGIFGDLYHTRTFRLPSPSDPQSKRAEVTASIEEILVDVLSGGEALKTDDAEMVDGCVDGAIIEAVAAGVAGGGVKAAADEGIVGVVVG